VLFRLGEQLFQPIQADRLLADLRHEPEATAADDAAADFGGTAGPFAGWRNCLKFMGSSSTGT
jgi:hypothetical protein